MTLSRVKLSFEETKSRKEKTHVFNEVLLYFPGVVSYKSISDLFCIVLNLQFHSWFLS